MKKEKLILTDCDGCLCNWNSAFEEFMNEKGLPKLPGTSHEYNISARHNIPVKDAMKYVREFNESDRIEHLKPFADSVEYVEKLVDLGFRFTVVTSISDLPEAKVWRTKNLTDIFGDIFNDIHCIKMGSSKANILMNWADTGYFWIEDHTRQAEAGYEAGLKPILIDHPYNKHFKTDLFPRVSYKTPWKEIYEMVCEDYDIVI